MIRENLKKCFSLYDLGLPAHLAGKAVVDEYIRMIRERKLKFPRGYVPTHSDNYCAMFVSLDLMTNGYWNLIECGAQKMMDKFEKAGLLFDKLPEDVDLNKDLVVVFYDWQKNGWVDHVGWLLTPHEDEFYITLEGNVGKQIRKVTRLATKPVAYGVIRNV